MSEQQTQAEKFAAEFNNDGECFATDDERSFVEVLRHYQADAKWLDGDRAFSPVRNTFPDGSIIIERGPAWDFGYADCYCLAGNGHTCELRSNSGVK